MFHVSVTSIFCYIFLVNCSSINLKNQKNHVERVIVTISEYARLSMEGENSLPSMGRLRASLEKRYKQRREIHITFWTLLDEIFKFEASLISILGVQNETIIAIPNLVSSSL